MRRRASRSAGFTLIEVVTSFLLLTVLGGVIGASVASTVRANLDARDYCEDAAGLGRALEAIERDLRAAQRVLGTGEGGRAGAAYMECVPLPMPAPTLVSVTLSSRDAWGRPRQVTKAITPTAEAIAAVVAANSETGRPGGGSVGTDVLTLALAEGTVRWRIFEGRLERLSPGRPPAPYARNIAHAAAVRTGALVRVEVELGKRAGEASRRPVAVTEVLLRTEDATR